MEDAGESSAREQDRYLPIANISRIMKKQLPGNAKIAKDAKETVQECVSEFISFITSEASDKCAREKRKTINGDDLLWSMTTLGFDEYLEPLRLYLAKFREAEANAAKGGGAANAGSASEGGRVTPTAAGGARPLAPPNMPMPGQMPQGAMPMHMPMHMFPPGMAMGPGMAMPGFPAGGTALPMPMGTSLPLPPGVAPPAQAGAPSSSPSGES